MSIVLKCDAQHCYTDPDAGVPANTVTQLSGWDGRGSGGATPRVLGR